MNVRVDTDAVRGGGRQVEAMADRLVSTFFAAESTLQAAAAGVGQPAVETALDELLSTLKTAHSHVTTGLSAFAREVQIAADVIAQTDVELADAVPEAP